MTHEDELSIDAQGWMAGARRVPSPNCDERPPGCGVDLLVVHNISLPPDEFGGPWVDRLFTNRLPADAHPYFAEVAGLRVSSHLLIRRDGELVQYVSFLQRAWHAGASSWQGREACNDYSVGIELEGGDHIAFETAQYLRLAAATRALMRFFPGLTAERIVGHSDIAPGRKTDPGAAFDWARYRAELSGGLA